MPTAFDFSEVPGPSPDEIKANDGVGILIYGTGRQQDAAYVQSITDAGLEVARIWEHNTDSILGGYDYGVSECRAFEQQNPPGMVYLACDLNDGALGDGDPLPFCRGWGDTTREPDFGVYGPDHFLIRAKAAAIARLTRFWGVVNWIDGGYGDNDPRNIQFWTDFGAHLIQLIGGSIDGTDANKVLKADWAAPAKDEDDMANNGNLLIAANRDPGSWWVTDGVYKHHVLGPEADFMKAIAALTHSAAPAPAVIDDSWFDSYAIAGAASVDTNSLAAALAPILSANGASGLTKKDVHDAIVQVLGTVHVSAS